jgi:hypothetical protein
MSNSNNTRPDFSRYFTLKQRAFLINISEGRDRDQYESLSGVIVNCSRDSIALQISYPVGQMLGHSAGKTTFKLTSESMGHGFQIMADLVEIAPNNIYHLKLQGGLEMYQRRQTPRIDTTISIFQIRRDASLAVYRKEFKRIMDGMKVHGARPSINLQETPVNLSAGGMRISVDALQPVSPLTMLFLDLDPSQPLVCAVAETVWVRREKDGHVCGYRFVQISKADQERISRYVQSHQKDQEGTAAATRVNWVLVDRMISEEPAGKP